MLQLKGAGPTLTRARRTVSRLCAHRFGNFCAARAMHHLGVPTTRALSLVGTGEDVVRDMFYDGNARPEPGAVVCVAPSFTRFGNFEILAARDDIDVLRQLADHTIRTDFPHLGEPGKETYLQWFTEICERTADMIIHWMRVGFVRVMNTDNMSIWASPSTMGRTDGWKVTSRIGLRTRPMPRGAVIATGISRRSQCGILCASPTRSIR